VKKEQKDNIENLMYHMVKNNYKEICDKIKVLILEKLIELSLKKPEGKEYITFYELEAIKRGIDDLRIKDREAETNAIATVIDNLISRGDNYINTPIKDKMEVKVDGTTTDGIPSKTKVLGILPNEL
jgi:hypothetical protein